jgi:DNA-3-methyladenine glycosylase
MILQIDITKLERLGRDFFKPDVVTVAKALIGAFLVTVDNRGNLTGGKIIETEAYDETDPAAHCHPSADRRRFGRCGSMRMEGGHAYVYSYRINVPHDEKQQMWCLNFSCDREGFGSAVLIRALEPVWGPEMMQERRVKGIIGAGGEGKELQGPNYVKHLCNGPAKLCEAIGVAFDLDGKSLFDPPFELYDREDIPRIVCGPRVGVTKSPDAPRRRVEVHQHVQSVPALSGSWV